MPSAPQCLRRADTPRCRYADGALDDPHPRPQRVKWDRLSYPNTDVSSSEERIERAKDDWRNRRFPRVPGDEIEFIPLPE